MDGMQAWHLWTVAGVLCVIAEILTVGFFFLWFGLGAFCGAVAAILGWNFSLQLSVFVFVSFLLLVLSRGIFRKVLHRDEVGSRTNVDALLGRCFFLAEEVRGREKAGKVLIFGEEWSVLSDDPETIYVDQMVEILNVEGNKLIVREC